jgi:membrane associated rhomboid family serine protease
MALLPLKDDNTIENINFQYVTISIIASCVIVFLWQLSLGDEQGRYIFGLGTIPSVLFGTRGLSPELTLIPEYLTTMTSLFLHGGWMHLIFNMLFLWVFGDNVEDAMGHLRYIFFYLVCGILATLSHAVMEPSSGSPLIGASGAISGVLGAYLVLHPKSRVLVLFMNIIPLRLPAIFVLGGWIGLQFLSLNSDNGTAWWAHIGGFLAGMILVVPFRQKSVPLFDGAGRFGPDNPNVVDLAERKHARSIFPNTVAADSTPYPWGKPPPKPSSQPLGVVNPKDLPGNKKPPLR